MARTALALLAGTLLIYLMGSAWLGLLGGLSMWEAAGIGILPFLPGGMIKIALITVGVSGLRDRLDVLFPSRR